MRMSFKLALLVAVSFPAMVFAKDNTVKNYTLDENIVENYKLKEQKTSLTNQENFAPNEQNEEAPKIIKEEIIGGHIEKLITKEGLVIAQKKVINNEIVERILNEYHPNGNIARQIISTDNSLAFFAEEYYPNGQRSSSVNYLDDKNKIGIERKYDINGKLRQEIPWIEKNGTTEPTTIRYGEVKTYYPSGKLAAIFSIGKKGKNTFFDEQGKVIREIDDAEILDFKPEIDEKNCDDIVVELSLKELVELYEDEGDISYNSCGLPYRELFIYEVSKTLGNQNLIYSYDNKGMLRRITIYKNGSKDGVLQKFDGDGNLTAEILYKDGKKEGDAKGYFPTGEIAFTKTYQNGKVIGNLNCYFPTGEIAAQIPYVNGLKEGIAKLSSPNKTEIEYKSNQMLNENKTLKRKQVSFINMLPPSKEKCLNIEEHKDNLLLDITARANTIKDKINIKLDNCEDLSTYKPQRSLYVCKIDDVIRGYYPPASNQARYTTLSYNNENSQKIYDISYVNGKRQGIAKKYDGNKTIAELVYSDNKLIDTNRTFYPKGVIKDILSISDNRSLINSYDEDGKLNYSVSYDNNNMEQAFVSTPQKDVYVKFYENKPENIREVNKQNPLNYIEYNLALGEYAVHKDAKLHKVGKICGYENIAPDIKVIELKPKILQTSSQQQAEQTPPVIKADDAPVIDGLDELETEIQNIKEQDYKLENAIIPSAKEKKEQELAAQNIGPIAKPDINNLSDVVAKERVDDVHPQKEESLETKTEKFYYPNGNLRKTIKTKGSRTEEVKQYSKTGLLLTDTIYNDDSILTEKYYGSGQIRSKINKAYTDNVIMAFLSRIDFYNTGKTKYEINRINDTLLFTDKEYYPTGNIKQEMIQKSPLVFTLKEHNKDGTLAKEVNIVGANILSKEYNKEEKVQKLYLNNKEIPVSMSKDSDRLLKDSAKLYDKKGKLLSEFIIDKNSNIIKEYYDNSNLKTEVIFYNNGEISVKFYTKDSALDKFAYLSPDGKLHIQKPEVRTIPSYRERYWVDYNNPKWIENQDKYSIKSIGNLNLDTAAYIFAELEIEVPEIIKNIYKLY